MRASLPRAFSTWSVLTPWSSVSSRIWRMKISTFAAAVLLCATTASAQNAEQKVQAIVSSDSVRAAKTYLNGDHERFVKELITLTEIPAPSFKEQKHGAAYLDMLREAKLADVETDPEGNVMGVRKG